MFAVCVLTGCQLGTPASAPQAKSRNAPIPPAPMPLAAKPSKTPPRNLKAKQAAASQSAGSQAPSSQVEVPQDASGPQTHTTFYRLDKQPAKIPPVLMTKRDESMCRVKVGDAMPAIALPKLGGGKAKLAELYGRNATVVALWKSDRRMTAQLLADLEPDVIKPMRGNEGVAVVGIVVNESEAAAKAALEKAGAHFTNLLDADGQAFAELGSGSLPRVYVLDSNGKIVWFDIEYSMATRRELHQVLRAMTDGK